MRDLLVLLILAIAPIGVALLGVHVYLRADLPRWRRVAVLAATLMGPIVGFWFGLVSGGVITVAGHRVDPYYCADMRKRNTELRDLIGWDHADLYHYWYNVSINSCRHTQVRPEPR